MSDYIIDPPPETRWDRFKGSVKKIHPGVQAAIVAGIFSLLGTWLGYQLRSSDLQTKYNTLEGKVKTQENTLLAKTAEIQRLETLLTPFRTIALERYTGPEQEALNRLAQRIRSLEDQVKDVEKFKEIAAKYEFTPLGSDLKQKTIKSLTKVSEVFNQNNTVINITHESWTTPSTRKFTEQLASMMKEAGFNVKGPEFATVYLIGDVYPIEWGYNESQYGMLNNLYSVLSPIMFCDHGAKRKFKEPGKFRIHFAGQAVFESDGKVKLK